MLMAGAAVYMAASWFLAKQQEDIQARVRANAAGYPLACKESCEHVYCLLTRNAKRKKQ